MDGRPNSRNKAAFLNFFGVVWTLQSVHLDCEQANLRSHTRERRTAKRSGGKESGERAPRKLLSRLAAKSRALVFQREETSVH